jgi:hypothetical protein
MRTPPLLIASILLLLAPAVAAQSSAEMAARRLLLERAEAARDAGRHAEALELAARAGQIHMTLSVRLFIAEEQERIGQLAAAFGSADLCLREADSDVAARHREAVRERCRVLHVGLRARVGQVIVQVPTTPLPDLRVTVAGDPLNPAHFGAPMIVSPGDVPVTATAAGRTPWQASVRVEAGGSQTVRVELAPIEPPPPPVVTVAPTPPPRVVATAPSPPPAVAPPRSPVGSNTQRTLAWAAAGGAAAFVIGGVVASAVQTGATDYLLDANNNCRGTRDVLVGECLDRANTEGAAQAVSIVGYTVGAALAVTSVVLFVTAPAGERRRAASSASCGVGPGSAGVSCAFRF